MCIKDNSLNYDSWFGFDRVLAHFCFGFDRIFVCFWFGFSSNIMFFVFVFLRIYNPKALTLKHLTTSRCKHNKPNAYFLTLLE